LERGRAGEPVIEPDATTPEEAAAHYGAALQECGEARRRTFEVELVRLLWSALETREAVYLRVDYQPDSHLREALEAAKIEWDSLGKPFGFTKSRVVVRRGGGRSPKKPAFRWTGAGVEPVDWSRPAEVFREAVPDGYRRLRDVETAYLRHLLRGDAGEAFLYLPEGAEITDEHVEAVTAALNA
jgi:hypothetical protein